MIETYDVLVWDEDEEEFWKWGTTHKTGKELEELIAKLKEQYQTDVWAYLA